MDIKLLEEEAKASALRQVAQMIQRPDQLDKLDTYKKRTARKKAAVDAMLNTAVQSQLEGVRSGIAQLQAAADDVKTVGENLQEIAEFVAQFPLLRHKLGRLREENLKHSQYAAAMENLRHIFNVPETIEKTHELIQDGKLLAAHKNLMELETARDDLMFEVHRLNTQSDYDKNLLKSYFSEVEKLCQELAKQLWYIVGRTLEAVRGTDPGPQQVVTALRIIEREERIDRYYRNQYSSTGFLPVGRPRKWRQRCFEVLDNTVRQRIEGNQLEDRSINKQWLARYLEVCRRIVTDDLRVAKSGCLSVFPPDYEIYERFVKMYHTALCDRLREIAGEKLEKNELVQLLNWVHLYGSDQMLGKASLQIEINSLLTDHPVLPKTTVSHLCDRFLEMTKADIHDWLEKSLNQEKDDWYKDNKPEEDSMGCFYTALPAILFQMVEDQVQLAKEISAELVPSVVMVNVVAQLEFATRYKNSFQAYKNKHFEDRNHFQLFTQIMIAMANNCEICVESTEKVKKHIRMTMETDLGSPRSSGPAGGVQRQELLQKIDQLKEKWQTDGQSAVGCLLEEIYQDLTPHLSQLLTKKWASEGGPLETVCATLLDYHHDHRRLRTTLRTTLLMDMQFRILCEYLRAVENRRIAFSSYEERTVAADRLNKEGQRLKELFNSIVGTQNDSDVMFEMLVDILPAMADVLELRDRSLLLLEVSNFVRKYPDVTVDQLAGLIGLREDINRGEARQIAQDIKDQNKHTPSTNEAYVRLFEMGKGAEEGGLYSAVRAQNLLANLANRNQKLITGMTE